MLQSNMQKTWFDWVEESSEDEYYSLMLPSLSVKIKIYTFKLTTYEKTMTLF